MVSEEVAPGVVLDYNKNDEVVDVEMLNLCRRSSKLELTDLHVKTA